jgi:hypothetical protein
MTLLVTSPAFEPQRNNLYTNPSHFAAAAVILLVMNTVTTDIQRKVIFPEKALNAVVLILNYNTLCAHLLVPVLLKPLFL